MMDVIDLRFNVPVLIFTMSRPTEALHYELPYTANDEDESSQDEEDHSESPTPHSRLWIVPRGNTSVSTDHSQRGQEGYSYATPLNAVTTQAVAVREDRQRVAAAEGPVYSAYLSTTDHEAPRRIADNIIDGEE